MKNKILADIKEQAFAAFIPRFITAENDMGQLRVDRWSMEPTFDGHCWNNLDEDDNDCNWLGDADPDVDYSQCIWEV